MQTKTAKIMLLGVSPLPVEKEGVMNALGIRTWQFLRPLLADGHQVCLVLSLRPGSAVKENGPLQRKGVVPYYLTDEELSAGARLQEIHDRFIPDCIVSAGSSVSGYAACNLKTNAPIWVDQFGDLCAEAQMKAYIEGDDAHLSGFQKIDQAVLKTADVYSSVSAEQRYALIGKLGLSGRLNKATVGYEFVRVIPNSADYIDDMIAERNGKAILGNRVSKGDFVLLWSGSYNTWTDVELLFSALEKAMLENKKIKFVSSGGSVPGHNEVTYARFLKLIEKSPLKDRFIMLGWLPNSSIIQLYRESSLGINVDQPCYEAELGCRTRLLGWMKAGLPVMTTKFCGLTKLIEREKLGFIFPSADAGALAKAILELASKKKLLKDYAARAERFLSQELNYEKTTRPLRDWVENPDHSPDKKP